MTEHASMDWRVRIPVALFRRASQRAAAQGTDLHTITGALLTLYADEALDPLATDPIRSAMARRGGQARSARLTADERRASARAAANARWHRHD